MCVCVCVCVCVFNNHRHQSMFIRQLAHNSKYISMFLERCHFSNKFLLSTTKFRLRTQKHTPNYLPQQNTTCYAVLANGNDVFDQWEPVTDHVTRFRQSATNHYAQS